MNLELRQRLEQVARRIRSLRLSSALAACWLAWAAIAGAILYILPYFNFMAADLIPLLAASATLSATVVGYLAIRSLSDSREVARCIETRHPELKSLLMTAVEQGDSIGGHRPGYLQRAVIRDAVDHGRSRDWAGAVAAWKIWLARLANLSAFALLIVVCAVLGRRADAVARSGVTLFPIASPTDFTCTIDPGDTEIERGKSLLVVARFEGLVPADVELVASFETLEASVQQAADRSQSDVAETSESAANDARIAMARTLDDPKFAGRVPTVDRPLNYHVRVDGWRSETYRVEVFEYPELVQADADLVFPPYSSLEPRTIEDVRKLSAVEGSTLTLRLRLNKAVEIAELLRDEGDSVPLVPSSADRSLVTASWSLARSERFKLRLVDSEGRENRIASELAIEVVPNRRPKIVVEQPGRDVDASPLEEVGLAAKVTDDYGLVRTGIAYTFNNAPVAEVALEADGKTAKEQFVSHLFALEELNAEPDQSLSYYVWAEDIGPDGAPRRTMSDLFFVDVRPFEEIMRQGQAPTNSPQNSGEAGASQQAMELAELQKQIISGTWNQLRQIGEGAEAPDSGVLAESQQLAISQAEELAANLTDSESQEHLAHARKEMSQALQYLATNSPHEPEPLENALVHEQEAYQSLLKLRAREFQVAQSNREQSQNNGRSQNSRRQRQLDDLELKPEENRYESQSRAQSRSEAEAEQESRDLLDRLRQIARRQEDLNERLKQLQSELQKADDESDRDAIERELKRLREQQQQIMRDADELLSRMDQSEQRQELESAREKAAQSRSHLQEASKALEEGRLSQALTEGTRAEREFDELREEFRQRTANQFTEEMLRMRRQVRELDANQQQISQQLAEGSSGERQTLRDTGEMPEVHEAIGEQRRRLAEILEDLKETIEAAEPSEPLLARHLYDAARDLQHQQTGDALEVAQRLSEIGVTDQASEAMDAASRGVERLREGIEKAAESVLGGETEALERAHSEVEQLAKELEAELESEDSQERGRQESEPQESEEAERGEGARREGEAQTADGEPQPGENTSGDRDTPQSPAADQAQGQPDDQRPSGTGGRNGERQEEEGEGRRSNASDQGRRGNTLRGRSAATGDPSDDADDPLAMFFEDSEIAADEPQRGPITGEGFREWIDRARDVEEMLEDERLRASAATIRDRAQQLRADFKRHGKPPEQVELESLVAEPLRELGQRISEHIRVQTAADDLSPIDRDPVPPEYAEPVRRYHERLGSGE